MHDTKPLATYPERALVKQILVLFAIILALIPVVKAEDKSWYEIDGIKFRLGFSSQYVYFRTIEDGEGSGPILEPNEDLEGHKDKRDLFPVAIVFPETTMSSFSFRGLFFEYKPTIASEIGPYVDPDEKGNETYRRQDTSGRKRLYNDFFNASDRSFADANSKWALSGDTEFMFVYFGYYWGVFLPIGKHHRFFKIALGAALVYSEISVRLYLCEEYKISESEGKKYGDCVGKKEIDSATASGTAVQNVFYFNLWERYSENSIWKFIVFNPSASIEGKEKSNLKYKNHNNTTFSEQPSTLHVEIFSYTYRF